MQPLTAEMPAGIDSDVSAAASVQTTTGGCLGVVDKVHCWLYDPQRGMCPYLEATNE
ncbi:hypothetical protein PQQ88_01210 [Paraburkholderia caledonica]|uniref:hypothetical protein n=1 Tax=Paraburkholderia caledonica TaxID=134536 RepID=UPI0038BC4B36